MADGREPSRVELIIHHEAEADRKEQEVSSLRWEAARLISEELATGKSHRQLAGEIGKSHVHVGAMARVWRDHGGNPDYQDRPFNALYRLATGQASQDRRLGESATGAGWIPPVDQDGQRVDVPEEYVGGRLEVDDQEPHFEPSGDAQPRLDRRPAGDCPNCGVGLLVGPGGLIERAP